MLGQRESLLSIAIFEALIVASYMWLGPFPHDSWLRTPEQNQAHGLAWLPRASMLQAADSCRVGHFHTDETYGYWVQDFQLTLAGPTPDAAFERLVRQPEPVGQLYGLIGLSLTNGKMFEAAVSGYEPPDTLIFVADKCEAHERYLPEVFAEIKNGDWGTRLTRRRIDVH